MKQTLWQRLDLLARNLTPLGLVVVVVLVGVAPMHIPDFARVAPLLPLIAVYHWTIYRPDLMPAPAVFLVGLLQDLMGGGPLGIHTLVLLGVFGVVLTQRRFFLGKPFVVIWLGFVLVAAGAVLWEWALMAGFHLALVTPRAFLFQYLLTLAMFPPLSWMFLRWQQLFLREE